MRKTIKAWAWKEGAEWKVEQDEYWANLYHDLSINRQNMLKGIKVGNVYPCTITIDVKEKKRGKAKAKK